MFRKKNIESEKDLQARLAREGFRFLTIDKFAFSWIPNFLRRGSIEPSGPEVSRVHYEQQFGDGNVVIEPMYKNGRPLPLGKCVAVYVKPRVGLQPRSSPQKS